jgi:hypothetical protein
MLQLLSFVRSHLHARAKTKFENGNDFSVTPRTTPLEQGKTLLSEEQAVWLLDAARSLGMVCQIS